MRRREFIGLLSSVVASRSIVARAQQGGKRPVIGVLGVGSKSGFTSSLAAFVKRLRELGWIEGDTVSIEYRWGEGHGDRVGDLAAELVRAKVDVIVTDGNQGTTAAKRATSSIPIVFAIAGDPVGTGLVASLARPGGNATGMSLQMTDTVGKRIELLREVVPTLRTLAVMANPGNSVSALEMQAVVATARALKLDALPVEIRRAEEIAPAIDGLKGRAEALYVGGDPLLFVRRADIGSLALGIKLPSIGITQEIADAGALMGYGPNFPDLFRRAAEFVDKILHGAKPSDLPVEQPTQFDLTVNMKTAKALDVAIPQTILVSANQLIE